MTAKPIARPPARAALVKTVVAALDDMKAVNVKVLDVRKVTDVSDCMVVASGNSDRHVRSIADRVLERSKVAGFRPLGVEGERDGEWVLVDLNDVIVHVMLPRVREFYALENLWEVSPSRPDRAATKPTRKKKAAPRKAAAAKSRVSKSARGKSAPRAKVARKPLRKPLRKPAAKPGPRARG
jgi:ribosome-associated protein